MGPIRTSFKRYRLIPIGVLALAAVTLTPAGPAHAASDYSVPIPLHPIPAGLRLIGASDVGVAVEQDDVSGNLQKVNPVFTGPLGGELTRRPEVEPLSLGDNYTTGMLTVKGSTLAWSRRYTGPGSQLYQGNRLSILTGKNVAEAGVMAQPQSFNGESWFSHAVQGFTELPENWPRPLRRYHAGTKEGGSMKLDLLIPHVPGVVGGVLASDQTSVLRATLDTNTGKSALDLVALADGKVTRIAEGTAEIAGVALSDDLLVWATKTGDGFTIHQRSRADGSVVTYDEPDAKADVEHMVAGDAGVGYLVNAEGSADMGFVIVNGDSAHRRVIAYPAEGLAAAGDHFLTASGAPDGTSPGVYRIDESEFNQVAIVPAAQLPPQRMTLSAGTLHYSYPSNPGEPAPGGPVLERIVAGDRRLKFSEERWSPARTSGQIAFSAARGVVSVPDQPGIWQLLDQGSEGEKIEAAGLKANVSGPYTLIGGKVFRPDGEHIYTEPTGSGQDDLFGSRIVYVRKDAAGAPTIWVDDVEKKTPTALATLDVSCDPQVSVWGELVAWTSSCGGGTYIRNLQSGVTRQVAVGGQEQLSLSEGTLTWSYENSGPAIVMDLTRDYLAPVRLPGQSRLITVDDHLMAREIKDELWSPTTRMEMTPLPFAQKLPPRLIAALSPLGFSPNTDGKGDVWAPQFDITKPMRSVTLKIQNQAGTKTVATLEGTAPDGSVRGLRWNGLSSKGMQLPPGTYRWILSGRSADGDGTLIGTDGSAVVSGTIDLEL
jgi:hypothetical protein